jgi:CubicO group peptidase (beta-lactamase class C family)
LVLKLVAGIGICLIGLAICFVRCSPNSKKNSTHSIQDSLNYIFRQDSVLNGYFNENFPSNEPGAAVLVKNGDAVLISKGYGVSDIITNESATSKTLFNLGSISKTFVSSAILILQSEGKLSVEDDLFKYFPEFKNEDIAKRVRIKHLLTHTSGLPDIRYPWKDSVFYLTAKDQENWEPITKATQLNFDPGSDYEYSNPAFNALALIIEKVSGQKWQSFVSENIFLPSGMKSSTITDGSHPDTGVAHAYLKRGDRWIENDYGEEPTFAAAGNGGVWSSVEELELYHEALSNNVFLEEEIQNEATTVRNFPNWNGKQSPFIGWSWFIGKTKNGFKTVGHTGSQGGFRANYLSVPDKGWLIVILSSTPRNLEEHTNRIMEYLQTGQ